MAFFQKLIISAPADFHNPAQNGYGIGLLLLPDKVVSYLDSLAKKAVAFFKMSRSILSRWFSLRSLCSSSFSGVKCPLPGKAFFPSEANCCFQRFNTLGWIPKFRAASAGFVPLLGYQTYGIHLKLGGILLFLSGHGSPPKALLFYHAFLGVHNYFTSSFGQGTAVHAFVVGRSKTFTSTILFLL